MVSRILSNYGAGIVKQAVKARTGKYFGSPTSHATEKQQRSWTLQADMSETRNHGRSSRVPEPNSRFFPI